MYVAVPKNAVISTKANPYYNISEALFKPISQLQKTKQGTTQSNLPSPPLLKSAKDAQTYLEHIWII
jgi:hypothetical protein